MSSAHKWLKSTETIAFDVTDRVARITLNRPEKRNALSGRMLQEIHEALLEADDRIDVNVILLRGEGRDFCAGYDLTDSYGGKDAGKPDHDPALYRTRSGSIDDDIWQLERQQELTLVMLDLHKPIIAKIQGNCLAGGTDLAFSCDIVLAADDAKIGFPAARANGTPPTNLWLYHCGPQWAKRMLFSGDTISGLDGRGSGWRWKPIRPTGSMMRRMNWQGAFPIPMRKFWPRTSASSTCRWSSPAPKPRSVTPPSWTRARICRKGRVAASFAQTWPSSA